MNGDKATSPLVYALVAFALGLFVFLGAYDIRSPGLYYDEALFVNGASGGVTDLFIHKRLAGIPTMLMPYIGALKAWIYYPIFKIFGISLVTIRLPVILLAGLALWLTYRYVQEQLGTMAAVLFVLMASVEPSTVLHSRLDWGPTVLMMVFRGALLLTLSRWCESGDKRHLKLALLCVGLGVFDKMNFIWVASSAFLAAAVVYPDRFLQGRAIDLRRAAKWGGGGLLALVLFVATLNAMGVHLFKEIGITDFSERIRIFMDLFTMTLQGAGVHAFVVQSSRGAFMEQTLALSGVSVVACVGLLLSARQGALPARRLVFLALFLLFLAGQIFMTKKASGPHHFATLAPLWLIYLAVGLSGLWQVAGPARVVSAVVSGVSLIALIMTSLDMHNVYREGFRGPKINPYWDVASSSLLTHYLESRGDVRTIVAVDWGIATNVQALSNNRLKAVDLWPVFNEQMSDKQAAWIDSEFVQKGAAFVVHVTGREAFPDTRAHFLAALQGKGWSLRQVKTIKTADGQPYIEVYLSHAVRP